jgi:hypothetical protein
MLQNLLREEAAEAAEAEQPGLVVILMRRVRSLRPQVVLVVAALIKGTIRLALIRVRARVVTEMDHARS